MAGKKGKDDAQAEDPPHGEDVFSGLNASYLEALHASYRHDNGSVSPAWAAFFAGIEEAMCQKVPSWRPVSAPAAPEQKHEKTHVAQVEDGAGAKASLEAAAKDALQARMMIHAYRVRGHLAADLDPLGLVQRPSSDELDPATYGFGPERMDTPVFLGGTLNRQWSVPREILALLRSTYCNQAAIEYMHIAQSGPKYWLQQRIEGSGPDVVFSAAEKRAILEKLIEAEEFEGFLQRKYTGTKRFGLDGAETTIPALQAAILRAAGLGSNDIVLGMPHRGRLNVLAAVMDKPYHHIFHEFQGGSVTPDDVAGSGDVKYHLGASADKTIQGRNIHLTLMPNPSHLEAVDPVVLGKARARQDRLRGHEKKEEGAKAVIPLLLHGDAAFAGQGVVAECFGLSGLRGFNTGGTVHFIVNNQIGFTTSPQFARSSPYPSDVAKMVEAPIFHVNGDNPEAVLRGVRIAMDYRHAFGSDVVIDMFCYRRHGHNESDEPKFTQPLMYRKISAHPKVSDIYAAQLVKEGVIGENWLQERRKQFIDYLQEEFTRSTSFKMPKADMFDGHWSHLHSGAGKGEDQPETGVDASALQRLGAAITRIPEDFAIHPTLARVIAGRRKKIEEGEKIDWATAEALAFATLLHEGSSIRLSGQDSIRGTFSQRHAQFVDQNNERRHCPFDGLNDKAQIEVIDSNLSEFAVLGFEYGYSLENPDRLCLWEAQFGDFTNGAQVIIDQFMSSAERKWLRMSGLVLLLPHGYEGQGPEHSSARLERFLQLCAEENIIVVNATTPANYFHLLRRQIKRSFRKPLIVMTPKSLLRHRSCVSPLKDFAAATRFLPLLEESPEFAENLAEDDEIRRVILCSGKVYYDLCAKRAAEGLRDVRILRLEQIYPFPEKALTRELARFRRAEIVWCQEEPRNMGAFYFVEPYMEAVLARSGGISQRMRYIGRALSASTATGLMKKHLAEREKFLDEAFEAPAKRFSPRRSYSSIA